MTTPIIILAGGKSTRMGTDKLALEYQGETLLTRAVRRFGERFDEIFVSTNSAAIPVGAHPLPDLIPALGPISGLHAALTRFEAAFLVAADMPFADPALAERIIFESVGQAACAACTDGRAEPLFAFYTRELMPEVMRSIDSGDYSLHRLLRRAGAKFVELPPETLSNINRPGDYEKLLGGIESREV